MYTYPFKSPTNHKNLWKTEDFNLEEEEEDIDQFSRVLFNRNRLTCPYTTPKSQFRVMSYNILADSLVDEQKKLSNEYLRWEYRSNLIVKEIQMYCPDIICLQEVDDNNKIFYEHFEDDYYTYYKKRTKEKTDGCMTLIKKSKFEILEAHYLEFFYDNSHPVLCRDNVCLFVVIKSLNQFTKENVIVVANSHLLFNPKRGDIKSAQAYFAMKTCSMLCEKYKTKGVHVIWGGDLNITPQGGIYEFISKSKFNFGDLRTNYLSGQNLTERENIRDFSRLEEFLVENVNQFEYHPNKLKESNIKKLKWVSHVKSINLKIRSAHPYLQKIEYSIDDMASNEFYGSLEEALTLENDFEMTSAYAIFQKFYSQLLHKEFPEDVLYTDFSTFEPIWTHVTELTISTVDYIWYTTRYKHHRKTMKPVAIYQTPKMNQLSKFKEFPNKEYPSDHISLIVDFDIN